MALLTKLKKIRMKTKYTVYGFIRRMEKELEIPSGIIDLFILFYGNGSDEWDPQLIPTENIELDKEKQIVTTLTAGSINVYMKRIVEYGYHEWKMKVKYGRSDTNSGYSVGGELMIGLWRVQKDKKPPQSTYYTDGKEQGYGFHVTSGQLIDHEYGYGTLKKYGEKVTDGIIDMILDFNRLSLSFKIDGKDYGKAFDITQDKYRAAIYFNNYHGAGDYVQILE